MKKWYSKALNRKTLPPSWGSEAETWRRTVCSFGLGRRARAAIKSRLPSPIPSLRMNLNFHQTTKRRRRLNQTSGFHSSLHPLWIARTSLHYSSSLLRHPFSRKREKRWAGCAGMPFGDSLTMELKVRGKTNQRVQGHQTGFPQETLQYS